MSPKGLSADIASPITLAGGYASKTAQQNTTEHNRTQQTSKKKKGIVRVRSKEGKIERKKERKNRSWPNRRANGRVSQDRQADRQTEGKRRQK